MRIDGISSDRRVAEKKKKGEWHSLYLTLLCICVSTRLETDIRCPSSLLLRLRLVRWERTRIAHAFPPTSRTGAPKVIGRTRCWAIARSTRTARESKRRRVVAVSNWWQDQRALSGWMGRWLLRMVGMVLRVMARKVASTRHSRRVGHRLAMTRRLAVANGGRVLLLLDHIHRHIGHHPARVRIYRHGTVCRSRRRAH